MFEDKDVGTGKQVIVTNITLENTWSTNYELTKESDTKTADITKATLKAVYVGETVLFGRSPRLEINITGFVNGENETTAEDYVAPTISNLNTQVGSYELTPYGGSAKNYDFTYESGTLVIEPNKSNVTVSLGNREYTYTGEEHRPQVTVGVEETILIEGQDYDVTYINNIDVGIATVEITLKGNYAGTVTENFIINKAEGTAQVTIEGWTYGESAKSPIVTSTTNDVNNVTYTYYIDEQCTTKTTSANGATEIGGKPVNSGKYYVKATIGESKNYKEVQVTTSFEIKKAILTPTAVLDSKTYDGRVEGTGKITFTDAVNNELPTATAIFTYTDATSGTGKTVNVTDIELDTDWNINYELSKNNITLTNGVINKAILTASYNSETINYGEEPKLEVIITGFVNDETEDVIETKPILKNVNTKVGTYTLTPEGGNATNYSFKMISGTLTINKKSIQDLSVSLDKSLFTYDGIAKEPVVTILYGETTLVKDIDYTVSYINNVNAGTANVVITGIGNYDGTITKEFTIQKANMSVEVTNYNGTYDGKSHTIILQTTPSDNISIYYSTNTELTNSNYDADGNTSIPTRTSAGTDTVYYYIHDTSGNYNDYSSSANNKNGEIQINAKTMLSKDITAKLDETTFTYSGKAKEPTPLIKDGDTTLIVGTDYTVRYEDNINAGTAKVIITGTGNYSGELELTFTITKKALTVNVTVENKVYDGTNTASCEILLTGIVNGEDVTVTSSSSKFANSTVGANKTVTITGITLHGEDSINYRLEETTVTTKADITKKELIATYVSETIEYGETPKLEVIVTGFVGSETAETAAGYTAPEVNNTNTAIGEYELTPEKGTATNYSFKYVSGTLTINARSNVTVTLSPTSYTYDGTAKKPTVTVKDNDTGNTVSTDNYTVTYTNNINAGTATVKVTLKGVYSGTVSKTFTINKATRTITATTPQYVGMGTNKNVTFTYTGNSDVTATVVSNATATIAATMTDGDKGGTVKITGVAAGTGAVTITVPEDANYKKVTKTINVTITDFTIAQATGTIAKGGTITITPTITPASIVNTDAATTISWKSSSTSIATVSNSSTTKGASITVTGVADGTATITATLNGQSKTAKITVNSVASTTIGDKTTYYTTVQKAIDAAGTNSATVKLLYSGSRTEAIKVAAGQNITLNTNGATLTSEGDTITNEGTLIVNGKGTITGTRGIINNGTGKLTVSDITVDTTGHAIRNYSSINIASSPAVKIVSGTIKSMNSNTIVNDSSATGLIVIDGGNISSDQKEERPTVINYQGKIIINGGEITSTNNRAVCQYQDSKGVIEIRNGVINGTTGVDVNAGEIIVTGGTINGNSAGAVIRAPGILTVGTNETAPSVSTTVPSITGNEFGVDVRSGTFNFYDGEINGPEGKSIKGTVSDVPTGYGVQKTIANSIETAILVKANYAEYTSTETLVNYYATLADATADMISGNTIKPLANVTETKSATVASGKTATIDLNGKTITLSGVSLTNNGTLTVTGTSGTLTSTGNTIVNGSASNSSAVFTKSGACTITGTATGSSTINNYGIATLSAGTVSSANYRSITNQSTGKLTVSGGTVTAENYAIYSNGTANTTSAPAVKVSGGNIQSVAVASIYNNSAGMIYITGGTVQGTHGIYNNAAGKITVSGGTITGTTEQGVRGGTGTVTVSGSSTKITGKTYGVSVTTGTATITAGTIQATGGSGAYVNGGTLTIGTNETTPSVSITVPSITGSTYGVRVASGRFNFYDGIIKGPQGASILGTVSAMPTGYNIYKTVDNNKIESATLRSEYTLTVNPNGGKWNGVTTNSTVKGVLGSTVDISNPTAPSAYTVTYNYNGSGVDNTTATASRTFNKWTLSGSGQLVNSSAISSSTAFTKTAKTETEGDYYNFKATLSEPTASIYYSIYMPTYTYVSGSSYTIKFKLRVNDLPTGTSLGFRNAAISNDYGTPGVVITRYSATTDGWVDVYMTRTISGTTTTLASTEKTIAPRFEMYTSDLKSKSGTIDFDIKDVTIYNNTTGTLVQSSNTTYGYGVGNGTITASYNTSAVTLPTPTKAGYTFGGWYKESSCTTKVGDGGASYTPTGNITLYAKWIANKYKVTLNNQSATTAGTTAYWYKYNTTTTVDGTTVYYYTDEAMSASPMKTSTITKPTKTGYTFGGYYTGTNGSGTQYIDANGKCINSIYKVAGNTTLYAKWTVNTYTVEYYQGNNTETAGATKLTSSSHTYGTAKTLTAYSGTAPSGWTFAGWSANNGTTATTVTYTNSQSVNNLTATNGGTVKLYAIFKRNVTFKSAASGGTSKTVEQRYNPHVTTQVTAVTPPALAAVTNWTALGYRADATASTATALTTGTVKPAYNTATPTYYGVYSRQITFKSGAPTGTASSTKPTQYLNVNGNKVSAVSAPAPTAITNWTALGYRANTTATTASYAVTTSAVNISPAYTTGNTMYAVYSRTLTIKYAGNSNTGGSTANTTKTIYLNSNQAATSSQVVTLATNGFTRTGYTFNKWTIGSTDYAGGASYTAGLAYNASSFTVTATAKWTEHTYTIAFNSNGGTGTMANITGVKYTTATTLTANAFTRTGYTFGGWNTKADGTGTSYENKASVSKLTATKDGTVTLYAKWTVNNYTITYDYNYMDNDIYGTKPLTTNFSSSTATGTTSRADNSSAKYGKEIRYTITKAGTGGAHLSPGRLTVGNTYTWSVYLKASKNVTINLGSEQNGRKQVNVTTSWQRFTHTFTAGDTTYNSFTFYATGGSSWDVGDVMYMHSLELKETPTLNIITQSKAYNSALGTLTTPTRANYAFQGWYTAPVGGTKISSTTTVPAANTTYYAHWTYCNYTEYKGTTTTVVKYYSTLADALSGVTSGNTIKPLLDFTETKNATLASGKTAILDLNGKTISMQGYEIINLGNLTIQGSGKIDATGVSIRCKENGNLTVGNVTVESQNNDTIYNEGKGTVTINGATVTSGLSAISQVNGGTVTVNSGNITGDNAIFCSHGTLNIYSGTLTGTKYYGISIFRKEDATVTVNVGKSSDTLSKTNPAIIGKLCGIMATMESTLNFNNGILKGEDESAIAAAVVINPRSGYDVIYSNDGTYHCATLGIANYAEYRGSTLVNNYGTLVDAMKYVTDGNTIKVLNNRTENSTATLASGKNVTFNLNGKTITTSANVNTIVNEGTLTVQDSAGSGTIRNTLTTASVTIINNKGTLTFSGSNNFTISGASTSASQTLINNSGTATLSKGTLEQTGTLAAEGTSYRYIVNGTGALTISGAELKNTSSTTTIYDRGVRSTRTITVSSGTITTKGATICSAGTATSESAPATKITGGTMKSTSHYGIVNAAAGLIYINSANASITGSNYGIYNNTGNVKLVNGEIIAGSSHGIYNNSTGTITVTGGSITSTTGSGIYNKTTGVVTVTGGSITSSGGTGIYNNAAGTVTIGTNESTPSVSTTVPSITGKVAGINVGTGTFNFYDGVIKGQSGSGSSIKGTISAVPTGYGAQKTTLAANSVTTETAILVIANYEELTSSGAHKSYYATLSSAMTNVTSGNTIKALNSNITENATATLASGKTAILEIAGKTINMQANEIVTLGNLTIQGNGRINSTYISIRCKEKGNLALGNAVITAQSGDAIRHEGTGTVSVDATNITSSLAGISVGDGGTVNVNAGNITGDSAIYCVKGTVNVYSGTLTGTKYSGIQIFSLSDYSVTVTIGKSTNSVSTNPSITGDERGIYSSQKNNLNFYNGMIRGKQESIGVGLVTNVRSGYKIDYSNNGTYNIAKLVAGTSTASIASDVTTLSMPMNESSDTNIQAMGSLQTFSMLRSIRSRSLNNINNVTFEDEKQEYSYKIEHYYQDKQTKEYVIDSELTDTKTAKYEDIINITEQDKKPKSGYVYEKSNKDLITISENLDENIIKLYYKQDNYEYSVHYFYDGIEDKEKCVTNADKLGSKIEKYEDKIIPGYKLEKVEPLTKSGNLELTIEENEQENIINVYYIKDVFEYKVHYFYDGVENKDEEVTLNAEFGSKIKTYQDKNVTGYKLEKYEPENNDGSLELGITEKQENNNINVYYTKDEFEYTVHYFYDGVEDKDKMVKDKALFGTKITEFEDKVIEKYTLDVLNPVNENGALDLTVSENLENNTINVYYTTQYNITAEVLEHAENYKDGKTKEKVKGGSVYFANNSTEEAVCKGKMPQNSIKITPNKTEIEEYEISKIVIKNGKEDKQGVQVDLSLILNKDGTADLPVELLADETVGMQSDKHIEVEFRKKTKVIVKHLEKETEQVLYKTEDGKEYEEITGYEGMYFETNRRLITNYQTSSLLITNENNEQIKSNEKIETDEKMYIKGEMYADTLTIIYWYEEIQTGMIVKHIEINEQDKKNGLTLDSGTVLEEEVFNGQDGLKKTTQRKVYNDTKENTINNKYKNYISAVIPENSNENIVIASEKDNQKDVVYSDDKAVEVRYYYEKQYNLTAEVKSHKEIVSGVETDVNGGKILGEQLNPYEVILEKDFNKKSIEINPEAGYRVKSIEVNGKVLNTKDFEKENHKLVLQSGYFKDVQEDIKLVVEFEKIPAKVIVKYQDIDTKEDIKPNKEKLGIINDEYNEERLELEGYINAGQEPQNSKGKMTEEQIVVTYWYTRQFKITTYVTEHEEKSRDSEEKSETKMVKGGKISGEDLNLYEIVSRGKSNSKEIVITPDSGYRIKDVTINGKSVEIKDLVKEDKNVYLPVFENIQEDKVIKVEFEKIPSRVIVKYLEEKTEKTVGAQEIIEGIVNDKYTTKPKELDYYEIIEEKYPDNSEGLMTEDEITVIYYYKKNAFNLKIENEIEKIVLNGNLVNVTNKNKAKVEIKYKNINEVKLEICYKIKVTNNGKLEGKAVIEQVLPANFEFVKKEFDEKLAQKSNEESNKKLAEGSNEEFKERDGKYLLETDVIKPEQVKEYEVYLRWIPNEENENESISIAKIIKAINDADYKELSTEDNESEAIVEVKLKKTIEQVIEDIIQDVVNMPKTGQSRIIYISAIVIAGICFGVIIWKRNKNVDTNSK